MKIGGYYKHYKYHDFIKVQRFELGYYRGISCYKNENGAVGIQDSTVFDPGDHIEIEATEFLTQFHLVKDEIYKKLNS